MAKMRKALYPCYRSAMDIVSLAFLVVCLGACRASSTTGNAEAYNNSATRHGKAMDNGTGLSGSLQESIDSVVHGRKMDVGVSVVYNGRELCRVNAGRPFPMMSVYKLHQAMAITDSIGKAAGMTLQTEVEITDSMLRKDTYSPLRDKYPAGGIRMTLEEILQYSLWLSDNNACDILFGLFGGTGYCDSYIRHLGLRDTRIVWTEAEMHEDISRCKDNSTTPSDATRLLDKLMNSTRHEWLRQCLMQCQTGADRLPATLPTDGTRIGHKTGTGGSMPNGLITGVNDIGFVALPDGRYYCIAVFCDNSEESLQETASLIADISGVCFRYIEDLQEK